MNQLFDPYAELAKIRTQQEAEPPFVKSTVRTLPPATTATPATQTAETPVFAPACRNVAVVAGVQREITKAANREKAASLHGYSVGGRPLTATGKIISLNERR